MELQHEVLDILIGHWASLQAIGGETCLRGCPAATAPTITTQPLTVGGTMAIE